jgi:hypothetical protein
MGQFRRGEPPDPATYVATIAAVLAQYPEDIMAAVTAPTGFDALALKTDFFPTPREVRDACETIAIDRSRREQREASIREMIKRRHEEDRRPSREDAAYVAMRLAETKAALSKAEGRKTEAELRKEAEVILARYLAEANSGPMAAQAYQASDELRKTLARQDAERARVLDRLKTSW